MYDRTECIKLAPWQHNDDSIDSFIMRSLYDRQVLAQARCSDMVDYRMLESEKSMKLCLAHGHLLAVNDFEKGLSACDQLVRGLAGTVLKRRAFSLKAIFVHPDGVWTQVKFKAWRLQDVTILELKKHQGDAVLFMLLLDLWQAWIQHKIAPQSFSEGQLEIPPSSPRLRYMRPPFDEVVSSDLPPACLQNFM